MDDPFLVVVAGGGLKTCVVVDALIRVREHRLWHEYGPPKRDLVAVYRPLNLPPEEIDIIVAEAREQVGKGPNLRLALKDMQLE